MNKLLCRFANVWLTGCATPSHQPQRYAWVTGLKPEEAARYEALHAHRMPVAASPSILSHEH